jgi:hypothetical protein
MTLATFPFGSTGHVSSRVIFGGAALGGTRQGAAETADMAISDDLVNAQAHT